jgi:hypothetical protein
MNIGGVPCTENAVLIARQQNGVASSVSAPLFLALGDARRRSTPCVCSMSLKTSAKRLSNLPSEIACPLEGTMAETPMAETQRMHRLLDALIALCELLVQTRRPIATA